MTTHEQFIARVASLAIAHAAIDREARKRLSTIKLVYGSGPNGTRGVTYYNRWRDVDEPPVGEQLASHPFVEICAFGQESWLQVAGTTLHELGHVLAGWDAAHGSQWKEACAALGLRRVHAAGTCYRLANFTPIIREALWHMPKPNDGEPVAPMGAMGVLMPVTVKPCSAGIGTRGGKSRGPGSGSRYRRYTCDCGMIVRCASDNLRAQCLDCTQPFKRS